MSKMVVIGIGSILMRDDGIGIRVAESIKEELPIGNIEVIIAETDFEFALSAIHDGDFVIILDAICTGKRPGYITTLSLDKAIQFQKKKFSQHEMNSIDLICSRYRDINGYFIGIEAAEIGFGIDLSQKLLGKYKIICEKVKKRIIKCKRLLANA